MNSKAPTLSKARKVPIISDEYPEHEKLSKVSELSQSIGEVLEWLSDAQQVWLAKYDVKSDKCRNCDHPEEHDYRPLDFGFSQCSHAEHENGTCDHGDECEHFGTCKCDHADFGNPHILYPWPHTISNLLTTYFKIDQQVLEQEKRAMLDNMRRMNDAASR